jgi:hypothetical protein
VSKASEPVLSEAIVASKITVIVTALVTIAVAAGVITADEGQTVTVGIVAAGGGLVAVVNAVAPIWRAWKARDLVTPVANPRDASGGILTPPGT